MLTDSFEQFSFHLATAESNLARMLSVLGESKTVRGLDGQSPRAFVRTVDEQSLRRMSERLRSGTWDFIPYREKLILKGYKVPPRRVSVPSARDRIPLKVLASALTTAAPGARRVPPQHAAKRFIQAARDTGFDHVVRLDIRNFYPSITHEAIRDKLDEHVTLRPVREMLTKALITRTVPLGLAASAVDQDSRGVPQGLPVSNSLAELAMLGFDDLYVEADELRYFRYADDMIFLTRRDKHRQIFRRVRGDLALLGVAPHGFSSGGKSQWSRLSDGVDFLGYRVSRDRISVRPEGIHRLKRKIAMTFARYKEERRSASLAVQRLAVRRLEWFLNLRITGCYLDGERRGWVQYYSLLDDFKILRDLDFFTESLMTAYSVADDFIPRSFVATYRKWAKRAADSSGYIPNFDAFDAEAKSVVLMEVFGVSEARMIDNGPIWVDREFARRARLHVHSMERDLTPNY